MSEQFGQFDFGLDAEQEERAARLHSESIIVDMMFAGPCGYRCYTKEMEDQIRAEWEKQKASSEAVFLSMLMPGRMATRGQLPDYKNCWDASGITAGTRNLEIGSYEAFARFATSYTAEFDHLNWLIKALCPSDIRRAKAEGKHAGFFYCQPLTPISSDLRLLDMGYAMGLRMLQLTYNNLDLVGAGCTERVDAGLSNLGTRVVRRANELGIIVDTSHCGRQTTLDACKTSTTTVLACHTSAAGIFSHVRAKSDEEIRAIAKTDGVIGVYAIAGFLSSKKGATIEVMLDHIEYIANLVGWQHVGLGTDWPMQSPQWLLELSLRPVLVQLGFRDEDIQLDALVGFDDYRDFPNITRGLVGRGFSDEQIRGILGENFLRAFETVTNNASSTR